MKVRIITKVRLPSQAKISLFVGVSQAQELRFPSRGRLMMNECRLRREYCLPAKVRKPQTQVNVVQLYGKVLLIKSADFVKFYLFNREAGASNRRYFMRNSHPP